MRHFLAVPALSLALAAACGETMSQEEKNKQVFLDGCKETIEKRLKAPSTVQYVDVTFVGVSSEPIDMEWAQQKLDELAESDRVGDGVEAVNLEFAIEDLQAGRPATKDTYAAFISYDAENGFGAPIRMVSTCQLDTYNKFVANMGAERVDGKTHTDWLIDGMQELRRNSD
ncbi:hypothetical protein KUV46_15660 [Thalassovita mediterranea]|nr:hypothetical protein KUV46_15660 [Thalassovita mediterranea]